MPSPSSARPLLNRHSSTQSSGVSHRIILEIRPDPLGAPYEELHERGCLFQKAVGRGAAVGAAQLRLEVPVKVIVLVGLWRVQRQVEDLCFGLVVICQEADLLGVVGPEVVQDQEHHLPLAVMDQPLHEPERCLGVGSAFQELEPNQPLAADGRHHRQAEVRAAGGQHRGVSLRRVAAHTMTVLGNGGLVRPVDVAAVLLGLLGDRRVDLEHPAVHVQGVLLQGLSAWALRRQAPALEVLASVRIGISMPNSAWLKSRTARRLQSANGKPRAPGV